MALLTRLFEQTAPRDLLDSETHLLGPQPGDFSEDEDEDGNGDGKGSATGPKVNTAFGLGRLELSRPDGASVVALPFGRLYTYEAVSEATAAASGGMVPPSTPDKGQGQDRRQRTAAANARAAPPRAADPPPALPFNATRVLTQCVVQLELVTAVGILANGHVQALTLDQLRHLLELLEECADFARRFNSNRPLREALLEAGFMKKAKFKRVPSLLR